MGGFELLFLVSESSMIKFSFLSYRHDCNIKKRLEKGEIDGQEQVRKFTAVIQRKDNGARLSFLFLALLYRVLYILPLLV